MHIKTTYMNFYCVQFRIIVHAHFIGGRFIRVFLVWHCTLEDGVFNDPVTIVYIEGVLSETKGQPSQR